jgi:hypothetical protein
MPQHKNRWLTFPLVKSRQHHPPILPRERGMDGAALVLHIFVRRLREPGAPDGGKTLRNQRRRTVDF